GAESPDRASDPRQPIPEMSAGAPRPPPASLSRHLEAFLEMLAAERGGAPATLAAYRGDLLHLARFLRRTAVSLERAATEDLRRYLVALARAALAPRSVARRLSALRQFYRFLSL